MRVSVTLRLSAVFGHRHCLCLILSVRILKYSLVTHSTTITAAIYPSDEKRQMKKR